MPEPQSLALGTAQFGLDYGITNASGQVNASGIDTLLASAWQCGMRALDTAPAYGSSESNLGAALGRGAARPWRVMTKTLPLRKTRISAEDVQAVAQAFAQSTAALQTPVDTLLLHHADDVLVPGGERLYDWLQGLKASGQVRCIGASIYDAAQAQTLLARYALDAVQLPASLADQRLLHDGTITALHTAGLELHVRSLYLQGLLLAAPEWVAQRMPGLAAWSRRFHAACSVAGLTALDMCIGFFRAQPAFAVAVLGATDAAQLGQLQTAWQRPLLQWDWPAWAVQDASLLDPRQWSKA